MVIGFLMRWMPWSYPEAHQWVLQCRPCIAPNPGFIRQLQNERVENTILS
jgi:hypothetical protein